MLCFSTMHAMINVSFFQALHVRLYVKYYNKIKNLCFIDTADLNY